MKNIILTALFVGATFAAFGASKKLASKVNPMIGSDAHGHVFVGANVPHGGVQLGPSNITQGWDWASGYHNSDSTIIGFAHTHLSGTGIGDYGDIIFMPVTGSVSVDKGSTKEPESGRLSLFDKNSEHVRPGYYSVYLKRYGINAELTATAHGGVQRYVYPANNEDRKVIIDLENGIGWDSPVEGYITQTDKYSVEGYRYSTGWAPEQRIYFKTTFSLPIKSITVRVDSANVSGTSGKGKLVTATLDFGKDNDKKSVLIAKTAVSAVDMEGARKNFEAELKSSGFDATAVQAEQLWNDMLRKIVVKGGRKSDRTAFYTAMYHLSFFPAIFSDVDKRYRGADGKIHQGTGDTYTVYSIWDTYRAANPLFTIIDPKRAGEFADDMIKIWREQGRLPVWHLAGNETDCMIGFHSIPVIVDAYLKGLGTFDPEEAYKAVTSYVNLQERGVSALLSEEGFIPSTEEESVAKALEYAIDDAAIARMAEKMGKTEDAEFFKKRSKFYTKYFDKNTGFMRGRTADGAWREPFDPVRSSHRSDDYCEGNAWQYTWLVPQDVEGLIELFGSREAFIDKLDELFTIDSSQSEEASSDISGLIGQFAMGNEPNHSTPYLYSEAGAPEKTAAIVRRIMRDFFTDEVDGLCGNEDAGQMSAWYIFSSMGFYPSDATSGRFIIGSPLFRKSVIDVGAGKTFVIKTRGNVRKNYVIKKAKLNGEMLDRNYIEYNDIMKGGTLRFRVK